MTRPDEPLPEFPPEANWLDAMPPEVSPEFVGRTIARLRDVGLVAEDARREADERALARLDLPRAELDAEGPDGPSPSFVDAVMAEWRLLRDAPLQEALPHYRVPAPSAEFVATTLRALQPARRHRLRLLLAPAAVLAAVAAALLVWVSLRREVASPEAALAQAVGIGAPADGPTLLGALLAAREYDDDLPVAPPKGWQTTPTGGTR